LAGVSTTQTTQSVSPNRTIVVFGYATSCRPTTYLPPTTLGLSGSRQKKSTENLFRFYYRRLTCKSTKIDRI
jgi:hypothetical protein